MAGQPVARWLVFLGVPLALWPLLAWLHRVPDLTPAERLDRAELLTPAGVVARPLPDEWRSAAAGLRAATYRLRFHADPATATDWAVYLPVVGTYATVALNGVPLEDWRAPERRQWRRPLLVPFAPTPLVPGENVLAVSVRADLPGEGFLGPVYVGPRAVLAAAAGRRHALTIDAVWVITLGLVVAAAFTAALWWQWRDPSYGWFAAAALAWAAINLHVVVAELPIDTHRWYGAWYTALAWWVVLQTRFLLAFLGIRAARLERGLLLLGLGGTVVLGLATLTGSAWLHPAARVLVTLALPALAYGAWQVLRELRAHGHDLTVAVPHVLGLSVVVAAFHDFLVFLGLATPTSGYYLPYAAAPVFVGMGWALLRRFSGALDATAVLVTDLERRVDAKRDELERSYERLQAVERARVLAEERERIMREMHDGLGSHLVSTLALLDGAEASREAVTQAIRAALDDLRLMIDALVPLDGDLLGALAMLRARMQPRLEAAGIRVEWRVADLPRVPDLDATEVLQVLRIVQEAFTNVLKHAAARTLTVRTSTDGATRPGIAVEIVDDGCGFDVAAVGGRGLQHMRQRAATIGADLEIAGAPQAGARRGTCVRLHLPLAPPVAS